MIKKHEILFENFDLGGKVKVKLQRIPHGTKWKQAKIDVIDSLSGFYVENLDPKIHEKFLRMLDDLQYVLSNKSNHFIKSNFFF